MDPEATRRTKEVLEDLEIGYLRRIPIIKDREPNILLGDIAALNIVLELKAKLEAG